MTDNSFILLLQLFFFAMFAHMGFALMLGGTAALKKAAHFWLVKVMLWPFRAVTRVFLELLAWQLSGVKALFAPKKRKKKRKKK